MLPWDYCDSKGKFIDFLQDEQNFRYNVLRDWSNRNYSNECRVTIYCLEIQRRANLTNNIRSNRQR